MAQNECDWCYSANPEWKDKGQHDFRPLGYEFYICDPCRLFIRNVISVVLHRVTHSELVEAIQTVMDRKGLTYQDLLERPQAIEPPLYNALDRSFDERGMDL